MSRHVLSPAAQLDLEQIWDYTCDRWGDDQAEKYVREIERDPTSCAESDDRSGLR